MAVTGPGAGSAPGGRRYDQGRDPLVIAVAFVPGYEDDGLARAVFGRLQDLSHESLEPAVAFCHRAGVHVVAVVRSNEGEPCGEIESVAERDVVRRTSSSQVGV